ncbi:thiol-disulfide oxidoreductase DCC family protein [Shimia marina]|uniref:Thiol-disulfide oxidoreductase DCC n=1 Tax=Shimia marina TaxID=321267 RepID=A0A0N7LSB5_9RHOB|nr:DUF393 domain-containing protein [Shimia marina]CUH53156.1 hypothetical protein SHM7688_02608 [Shimia marina]SFD83394.1 Predicted thiol-disulfide oxidoreductase YuxK, DCC family [Shimia marina]
MPQETRILYNADCPVCNAEICHYRSYSEDNGITLGFDDLNTEALSTWGLDADIAAKRLHVVQDGTLYDGIPAFIVLWQEMPRYRWLARLVSVPGIRHGAILIYDYLLAPTLYVFHLRRQRKADKTLSQ